MKFRYGNQNVKIYCFVKIAIENKRVDIAVKLSRKMRPTQYIYE